LSNKRRSFSDELKFRVVLEAIKGVRQISEIAAEFEVHPNQITNWKQQFLENGPSVFTKKKDSRVVEMEEKEENLFKKIGEQQIELDFFKKSLKKLESWRSVK
jgi:transposase-like protein